MSRSRRMVRTLAGTLAAALIAGVTGTIGARPTAGFEFVEVNLRTELTGAGVFPGPGDPDGSGSAGVFITPARGQLAFIISVQGVEGQTAAHIHAGSAGEVGPLLFTLGAPANDGTEYGPGTFAADADLLRDMVDNPGNFYIDVHTPGYPDGAVRGQLEQGDIHLSTYVLGAAEVPGPGDPDGAGPAGISIDVEAGEVCSFIGVTGISAPTAAHIHQGVAGVAGPIVLTLTPSYDPQAPLGCNTGHDPALLQAIADDATAYYINVHTADYPDGAVRGQLVLGNDGQLPPPGPCPAGELCFGVVAPGTYTWTRFRTDLSFTTSTNVVAEPIEDPETPDFSAGHQLQAAALGLRDPEDGGQLNLFRFIGEVYPDPCTAEAIAQIGRSPEDLIAWLAERPYLATTDPVAVEYGGAPGLQIDVAVGEAPACLPDFVFILPFGPGIHGSSVQLTGTTLRIVAQDVGDETIVTIAEDLSVFFEVQTARVQGAETFLPEAQAVIDSYEWALAGTAPPPPPQVPDTAFPNTPSTGSMAPAFVLGVLMLVAAGLGAWAHRRRGPAAARGEDDFAG